MLRFRLFAIRIRQFADEMSQIASLLPRFRQVGTYRSRRSPDLIRKSITLFYWKLFRGSEDFLLEFKCQLVHPQVPKVRYLFGHSFRSLPLFRYDLPDWTSVICPPSAVLSPLLSTVLFNLEPRLEDGAG